MSAISKKAEVNLSENSLAVLKRRYLRKGENRELIETVEEMFHRVAYHIASAEQEYRGDVGQVEEKFYRLLTQLRFFPNSPTFTGAGTPLGQLAACFVLPIEDDMGKSESGIFQTLRDAALIQQTGGGNGFSFSRLRPQGDFVRSSGGQATGPVGFLRVYDQAFGEVAQGGTRRGANMAVLRVDHPDIFEFISCKASEYAITNFNISVGITDKFMRAVEADTDFDLINPRDGAVRKTVRARELFDRIVQYAYKNGEPGVLFLDTANRTNPVPHLYELEATNPCGEQWLGPYENCCLGSINLAQHVTEESTIDWEQLQKTVEEATHFLDNVVTVNNYVPGVPQLKTSAHRARRIGLGIMGLADMMYHLGVRYGSEGGQTFAAVVMEFVRFHCMRTSIELAQERGAFPEIKGSIYDPNNFRWEIPKSIAKSDDRWGQPSLDWEKLRNDLILYGIRNCAQTTVAPTGTIATVTGCEGYGCEPTFALAYVRHVNDNGNDLQLQYTSPLFEKALVSAGLNEDERSAIIEQVNISGSCQNVDGIPDDIRDTFVVSADVTPTEHVQMQAAIQAFVDNSISKTCNFPSYATAADVAQAYKMAWRLGCKGLTVYVTGSRDKVVLETQATKAGKKKEQPATLWHDAKKPRATVLRGETHRIGTPLGTTYVTINENGGNQPFELFLQTAKAGSETAAVSEAVGRLISYILRLPSPISPRERLREVVRQLGGLGGGRPLGFGINRVLSLPDGVARIINDYLASHTGDKLGVQQSDNGNQTTFGIGDLCPECGEASFIREEGCRKCYSCSYSEC